MSENSESTNQQTVPQWTCEHCNKLAAWKCVNPNCNYAGTSHPAPYQIKVCDDCKPRALRDNSSHRLKPVDWMTDKERQHNDWADIMADMGIDIDINSV